jgi:hypothetical protein
MFSAPRRDWQYFPDYNQKALCYQEESGENCNKKRPADWQGAGSLFYPSI